MTQSNAFLRFSSPNERRTISREDLGYYNALVIAAVYEIRSEDIDVTSTLSFIPPLKHCVQEHPYLSVVVRGKDTEKPAYERVPTINLEDHLSIIHDNEYEAGINGETATFEKVLPQLLDRPWPDDRPPWRIVVLPLVSPNDSTVTRCFIAFAYSHTLGDGMVGLAFHRTFLNAWRQTTGTDRKESPPVMTPPPCKPLSEPFDTPEKLPISWSFLLEPLVAEYLPKSLGKMMGLRVGASTVDAGTWTGPRIFFNPEESIHYSRVKILEIEAPLIQKALRISRSRDAKLTAAVHQMIVRALSKAIPDREVTNFVSGTAVDMRGSVGTPRYTWGLFVSGHYEVHPRMADVTSPTLSDEMWTTASSMTKKLAECGTRLQDQAIGLLRYAPSIRNWTKGKIGQQRDCSYEVSNLLAFDDTGGDADADDNCKISKMIFTQPGTPLSAPLVFNIISVKGGSLVCTVSWQAGALGVPAAEEMELVDGICSSIRAGFEALGS